MIAVVQKPVAAGNWRSGRVPRDVRAVVLHVTEGSAASVDAWFDDPAAKVSAHFLVRLDGTVHQYVSVHDVAYHAGEVVNATWTRLGPGQVNAYTIGIEHEGDGVTPWPQAQLLSSAIVSAWISLRFSLPPSNDYFPLHREIKATKTCPGPAFRRAEYMALLRAVLDTLDPRAILTNLR